MSPEDLERKVSRLEARIRELEKLANMGKGAWWAILKLGALVAFLVGIAVAVKEFVK